jgi:gamma-glutamyltranspeptidase/glutathione hydrolase
VRFAQDGSPRVELEPSDELEAAVQATGLASHTYPGAHMYFGGVGAAELADRGLVAAGDARREAAVGLSA